MKDLDLQSWVGRSEESLGTISEETAGQLAATFGGGTAQSGAPLPNLAHWCAFTPKAPMSELGSDGHPKLGGFLPDVGMPRRMWAGGALEFVAPLHVGSQLSRRSTITSIAQKEGATGPMVFVTVTHELSENGALAVREIQDIVYLEIPDVFSPPPVKPTPTDSDLVKPTSVNEAMLFRFSAVTFNAHRIHYDLPYAKSVEKYPGLVVHGPLQAMLLIQAATEYSNRTPRTFSFRGIHPMFHFDDLHVFGTNTENGMMLCTGLVCGHQGMQAKIVWEDH